MFLRALLARQLSRPSGLAGLFMGRTLNKVNARVNALALERLALDPTDRVLDVGFGGGLILRAAAATGSHACGIEISQPMLTRARRHFRGEIRAGRIDIREASVSSIPYADRTFSKAVTINTLHFWPDPAGGCRELARVLMPGARLVIAVRPKHYLQQIAFTEHGFTAFEDEELRELLQNAAFSDIRIEHQADGDMGIVLVTANRPG
jgi:SAM-dependent methyltransferase